MKVLILTGKFGMGHVSAAKAIKEEIDGAYGEGSAKIIDLVSYLFPSVSKGIYKSFDATAGKCPSIYNCINKLDAHRANMPMKNWFARKFSNLMKKANPDLIISTWPVASKYIGFYKKESGCEIPFITCITDISAHNIWIAEETTAYFVGNEESKQELTEKGVPADRIYVCGIPVRREFKASEKVCQNKLDKNVLIMGGGLGIIPGIDKMLKDLRQDEEVKVTVIAGNNAKLETYLKEKYTDINVIGFTNQVADYMKQADVVITKAGGISMFEAIHAGTPMLVLKPFLEQEKKNAKYIEDMDIGRVMGRKGKGCHRILNSIVENDDITAMKNNMSYIASKCDENNISEIISHLKKEA